MRRAVRNLSWTLEYEGATVARLKRVDIDQPWLVCDFTREPGFDTQGEDEDDWLEAHATLVDDATSERIAPFLIRVDGDAAYLRI
jgi:hypothetical protein